MLPRKLSGSMFVRFWWEGCRTTKSIYWRSKELLQKHKFEGGVGLRDIAKVNVCGHSL